jgi:hypothetical protein
MQASVHCDCPFLSRQLPRLNTVKPSIINPSTA